MSAPPGTAPPPAYGPPPAPYPPPMAYAPPPKPKTLLPVIGGVFLIIAAIDGIATWAFVAFVLGSLASGVGAGFLTGIVMACGAIEIIFGIICLLGGVMAIMRRMWALGLIGGILGLFLGGGIALTQGILIPEASLFALIGMILVAISHKEF